MSKIKWIIRRYSENSYPKDVRRKFNRWLVSETDLDEKEEALEEILDASQDLCSKSYDKEWTRLMAGVNGGEKRRGRSVRTLSLRIAAAVAIVAVTSLATMIVMEKNSQEEIRQLAYYTKAGEKTSIVLPDSSVVTLNANSFIVYPENFSKKNREIYMSGEAVFSVTKDEHRPFVVNSPSLAVEVLGTVFNISDYSEDETSTVVLKNGKVKVHVQNDEEGVLYLSPGEQALYNRNSDVFMKSPADVDRSFAWEKNQIFFDRADMFYIAKILERQFGVNVNIVNDKYRDVAVTAKFLKGETLEDFIFVLKNTVPDFKYKMEGKQIYFI